jgi:hypothetical protein
MTVLKERYIVDEKGNQTGVILDMNAHRKILEDLEELQSIRAYDAAKESGDEAIPFVQAIKEIKEVNYDKTVKESI